MAVVAAAVRRRTASLDIAEVVAAIFALEGYVASIPGRATLAVLYGRMYTQYRRRAV